MTSITAARRPQSPQTPFLSPVSSMSRLSRARAAATAALGTLAAAASLVMLIRWGSAGPFSAARPENAEEVVIELMVWAAVALSGWLGLGSLLAVGATLPGVMGEGCQALARRLTPALLRQGVAVVIGTAVATLSLPLASAAGMGVARSDGVTHPGGEPGVAPAPATRHTPAAPSPVFTPTDRSVAASVPEMRDVPAPTSALTTPEPAAPAAPVATGAPPAPGPAWRPTRPSPTVDARRTRLLAPAPRTGTAMDAMVTVRRGDSLWSIAARHLGPGASDAEIALAWPRWYAANRGLIGSDPDHLVPGQQLCPPPTGEDQ